MGSTRLPGKVLLAAGGATMLEHHVQRLRQSSFPIFLATTALPIDDVLAEFALVHGLPCYRGSEADVLSRYYEAARQFGLGTIVRVTSDCPLIDGELVGAAVGRFLNNADAWEYRSNSIVRSYPRGFDFEIFSFEALREAYEQARLPYEREHVTPYLKSNPAMAGRLRIEDEVYAEGDFSRFRITLDTPEDFELIRRLMEEHKAQHLSHPQIINLLNQHPELVAINAHIEQKAG
ncbi:glycosyltransferase family protein [Hymenobacter sp. BT175]|nr:glycosyltransferase family protein [Hymenobacter translucens]